MESDILYRNALYFKKDILPYYFILKSNKGDIIIETSASDFQHLVGYQYCKNLAILKLKPKEFLNACLDDNISIKMLISDNYLNNSFCLSNNQKKILNKNDCLINLFKSLLTSVDLRLLRHQGEAVYHRLDTDYHHNKISGNYLDVLGVIGHTFDNFFSFNSIIRTDVEKDKNRFMRNKIIKIEEVVRIEKKEINNYLKNSTKIFPSPRNVNNKPQKNEKRKPTLNNQSIKPINKILENHLELKLGKYGKNSVQVYINKLELEKRLFIPKELVRPEEIADYINKKYK